MGAERGLRQRIRSSIRFAWQDALVVGQPANGLTGRGRPDFYVVVVGRFVGLEVKTSTGRATQIQLDRIAMIRRAGGYAGLVRSVGAALWLVERAYKGAPMAEEADFDIDKLLASFRPDDSKQEPDNLDREIAGFKPSQALSEEHIAASAQSNGTAAGDGEALGEVPSPTEQLARAVEGLTTAVRDLRITAEKLQAAQESQAARSAAVESPDDDLMALLGAEPEERAAEPEQDAPASPPAKRTRRRAP